MNTQTEQIVIAIQGLTNHFYRKFLVGINAWTALESEGFTYKPEHYVYINGQRDGGERYLHDGDRIAYIKDAT
jgi:hypothetical protein